MSLEGGDATPTSFTTTGNDETTDDEGTTYEGDWNGISKAYYDIQSVFAEVARDYPQEFFNEADKNAEEGGNPAGDAGVMENEKRVEQERPEEPPKVQLAIICICYNEYCFSVQIDPNQYRLIFQTLHWLIQIQPNQTNQ